VPRPPERRVPRAFELEVLPTLTKDEPWVGDVDEDDEDEDEDEPLLTCVKPPSLVPALESGTTDESGEAELSGAGVAGAAEASLDEADSSAGAAVSSVAGADWDVASPDGVAESIAVGLSSTIEAEKRSPANAASEAPAKNSVVNKKVVANRRLRLLGSPAGGCSGSGLPPKSQLSLRVNHRGIAVCSF
jgi:hypothetical protein